MTCQGQGRERNGVLCLAIIGPMRGGVSLAERLERRFERVWSRLADKPSSDGHPVGVQGDSRWRALEGRGNALNAIRLLLAGLVVCGHSFNLGWMVSAPIPDIHGRAVDGFFALSGFLIASSRSRASMTTFLWRRASRIYPGLWAALVVTAFVIAPMGALLSSEPFAWAEAASYVWSNATASVVQPDISGGPTNVHYAGLWNGSLWTLAYELICYLIFGLLLGVRRHAIASLSTVLIVTTALLLLDMPVTHIPQVGSLARFGGFFAAGALLWHMQGRVPLSGRIAAQCAAVVSLAVAFGEPRVFYALAPIPLAYVLLFAGATVPTRIGSVNDISYGMYIYAFPIQQLLLSAGFSKYAGAGWFVLASLVATAPLAWLSWVLVERPTIRLAHRSGHYLVCEHDPGDVQVAAAEGV